MKYVFVVILLFTMSSIFGQTDSVVTETYDLIYMRDGTVLKGQIISFDPSDGDITLVATDGRKYFLTSKDYSSFKEDIPAKKKKRDQAHFIVNERKENQYELSVGFTAPAYFISGENTLDTDTHRAFDRSYIPVCISAGFGKYIDRKHFIGIGIDFDMMSSVKSFYSVNLRYAHQYDAYKKNVSLYLPIELTFNHFRNKMPFQLNETDTSYFSDGTVSGYSFPKQVSYDVSYNALGLSIGQGFGFILSNKNSISFEIALFRYFGLGANYFNLEGTEPSYDYSAQGFKMALRYNF
ncbi:MAG: hypothetical protein AB8B72_11455 [Crocinitomicaceae bacterium]